MIFEPSEKKLLQPIYVTVGLTQNTRFCILEDALIN